MKKITLLSLVLCLTLMIAESAFAKEEANSHMFWSNDLEFTNPYSIEYRYLSRCGNAPQFDDWYHIEKETPVITAQASLNGSFKQYDFKYFQNDQTFANFIHNDRNKSVTYFKGSYLFSNNIFAALEYLTTKTNTNSILTPGYRFNIGDSGYVAACLNYVTRNDSNYYVDYGVSNYEVTGRYYTANSRIYGQVVLPNKNISSSDHYYLNMGGAYQISPNLVLGGRYYKEEDSDSESNFGLELGCTAQLDRLGIEFRHIDFNDDNYLFRDRFDLNLLYSFNPKIRGGFELIKTEGRDDLDAIAKVKYTIDEQKSFVFMHLLSNEETHDTASTYLLLDIKL